MTSLRLCAEFLENGHIDYLQIIKKISSGSWSYSLQNDKFCIIRAEYNNE